MAAFLLLVAAGLLWLGVDALLLSRHGSSPNPIEKDEMMFGKAHRRPVPESVRAFAERRYPFATSGSMAFYGWLFVGLGVALGAFAVGLWD